MLTPWRTFLVSVAGAAAVVVATAAVENWTREPGSRRADFNRVEGGVPAVGVTLGPGVTVRDQLAVRDVAAIAEAGVRTIIAMRPDGEEAGQPSVQDLTGAAASLGIRVLHLPTPVDRIPDDIADQLARHLTTSDRVLLYCGSGWRAARAWALAEASREGGAHVSTILQAVRNARHDIDDLKPRIEARFGSRKT